MEYGLLPPEINSARLYAGPGSAPMLTAASAWATLSTGLFSTAYEVTAAVGTLAATWTGPSSLAMAHTLTGYVQWLMSTASLAEQTANQASSAVAAYETAHAAIVPPPVIAANRAMLAMLVATNLLGQNAAAIAATEAQYAEYWAQDSAVMYGYAASSGAATQLPTFNLPPQSLNDPSAPSSLVEPAAGTGTVQSILGQLADTTTPLGFINQYATAFVSSGPLQLLQLPIELVSMFSVLWALDSPDSILAPLRAAPGAVEPVPSFAPASAPAPGVSVNVGSGNRIGVLSTPPSWATAQQPRIVVPLAPGATTSVTEGAFPMPLPIGAPRGGTPPKTEKPPPEYGLSPTFIPKHPFGG